ncbi:DNA polymerase III subunit gamma/tau [Shewanella litorisediminis]|uniref:DNA-directed DNA polymerase n=1 Tax=Shewanella litorisediminis TaxID=1173586 RepID=A0ABX7G6Z0_9GAMM|nr:DNA polymerase III subunit gamma/tau [Shewanella litorisediminis]MCL2916788.1 DNA polymerase III subunit gamma/tau [Shewanella litorisediminis]QRH03045.1 DNA polymerase III subunit gamma/tau [Shewanella litorisediminis]
MSYQVLARKWRPANFAEVVGQSHVLHALTNALGQQRLHHAYLFTGTRGVGKTSLARLFAKGLNCEQGITATPCGQCSACREIAEGRFVDLIEVDAASRTKVDDTREILDNVQYRPSRGRFKVYLIDEVHMLSKSSFNALLKTLEEPPEHVKFLLATTDPQKLPVTVLSRCLQFNLKALTQPQIQAQLAAVLSGEGLGFDEDALSLLAKAAAGSMRDALSLTDQAIAFGGGEVRLAQVQTMLGAIDKGQILNLFDALCQGDIETLLTTARTALGFGADADEVLRALLELLHQISLAQFAPATASISDNEAAVLGWAKALRPEQVQLYYQILLSGRKDLPYAPDPASGLEMSLLRAVGFVPEKPVNNWQSGEGVSASEALQTESTSAEVQRASKAGTSQKQAAKPLTPLAAVSGAALESAQTTGTDVDVDAGAVKAPDSAKALNSLAGNNAETALSSDEDTQEAGAAALFAEQNLLISQAESQGFSPEHGFQRDSEGDFSLHDGPPLFDEMAYADYPQSYSAEVADTHLSRPPEAEANSVTRTDSSADRGAESRDDPKAGTQAEGEAMGAASKVAAEAVPLGSQAAAFGDDLLDAVLAAREDLLSGITSEAKEDEAKKPVSSFERRRMAAQENDAVSVAEAPAVEEAQENDVVPVTGAPDYAAVSITRAPTVKGAGDTASDATPANTQPTAASDSQVPAIASGQGVAADYDRPPWEDAVTADDRVKAPVSSMAEASNSDLAVVETKAGHAPQSQTAAQVQSQTGIASKPDAPQVTHHDVANSISGDETDLRWYKLMGALEIGGRVRQLAVNSVCLEWCNPIPLVLKQDQKHLAAPVAIAQLNEALSNALGHEAEIALEVGEVTGRETPLDIRARFHRELLACARGALNTDPAVQRLMQQAGAWFDDDSIGYPPELLAQRGRALPAPPALAQEPVV